MSALLLFSIYRTIPFVILVFYDWALSVRWARPSDIPSAAIFSMEIGLVPALILIGGGYAVRLLKPKSRFGWPMLLLSAIVLVLNVPIPTCYSLYLAGGICT